MAEEGKLEKEGSAGAAQEKPKKEEQTNCKFCNKPLKKVRRYYKDGIYYCSRKCYKNSKKKKE